MNDIAIQVENLSKLYRLGQREPYKALRDILTEAVSVPFRRLSSFLQGSAGIRQSGSAYDESIWALKNVSFRVNHGEVLGIIGQNGAGKSTLLKILSRITEPTEGYVEIHGRVGSLLEVGTGFHPELTGRENIYLNGSILGMKSAEIKRKFDEIVAFAEVEQFIDTPVKRYSSGMYMRLAFAVAAHLEPEILIVDEVLAVGDAAFQKKSLGKMGDVAREGRTVLFVSHNLVAMQSLCSRVIWLQDGRIVKEGDPQQVISHYVRSALSTSMESVWADMTTAPGTSDVRLHRVCVRPERGTSGDPITVDTPLALEFDCWNLSAAAYIWVSIRLYNEQDILLFDICPPFELDWRRNSSPRGLLRSVCHIPGGLLNDGLHRVSLIVLADEEPIIEISDALVFVVQDTDENRHGWHGKWPGLIRPNFLTWTKEILNSSNSAFLLAKEGHGITE